MVTFDEFMHQLKKSSSQNMTQLEMHMMYLKHKSIASEEQKNSKRRKKSDSRVNNKPSYSTPTSQASTFTASSSTNGLNKHLEKLMTLRAIHQQKKSISSGNGLIESKLHGETMVFENVPNDGGGHCLFYSILYLMQRQGRLLNYTVNDIRRELADWLLQLKDTQVSDITWEKFVFFVADNQYNMINVDDAAFQAWRRNNGFEKYVQNLRRTNQWGRDIEIVAAGLLYEVNIFVYVLNNLEQGPIKAIEVPGDNTLNLLYRGGVHYEALTLLGS